jgi:hypothetical protein
MELAGLGDVEKKSWNGSLRIDDLQLQVQNGCIFEISKIATTEATREAMAKDMNLLVELLSRYYRTT